MARQEWPERGAAFTRVVSITGAGVFPVSRSRCDRWYSSSCIHAYVLILWNKRFCTLAIQLRIHHRGPTAILWVHTSVVLSLPYSI